MAGAIALSIIPTPSFSGEVRGEGFYDGGEQMLNESRRIEMLCGTDRACRNREARKRHYEMLERHNQVLACLRREAGTTNCRCPEERNVCRAEVGW